jgi:hypothetical protein
MTERHPLDLKHRAGRASEALAYIWLSLGLGPTRAMTSIGTRVHVSQDEAQAGFDAGERLAAAGVHHAVC